MSREQRYASCARAHRYLPDAAAATTPLPCCRRVLNYYGGENAEDAFDMRKALPRDAGGKSTRPYSRPIRPEEINTTMTPDV